MANVSKQTVVSSLVWKFLQMGGTQGVSFVVTLVLARLLDPDVYGSVSLVLVFTSIAGVFVQAGFNMALIQKEGATREDFSTVFWLSLAVSLVLYALLSLAAPAIAAFYEDGSLAPVMRVVSLILPLGAFNSVQVAYATKEFKFKLMFRCNLVTSLLSGCVGIVLALAGAGIWALVAQQLGNQLFLCLTMLVFVRWRPTLYFSSQSARSLFAFGKNVLLSNLLVQLFLNLRSLIMGKIYDAETLGYFNRGRQFPAAAIGAINGTIQSVMFPTFSSEQADLRRVRDITRRAIRTSSFAVFPLLVGLAVMAEPLVDVLLTEKWLSCVPYLQIFAVAYMFQPSQTISAQALQGIGLSRTTLRIEWARKLSELALMLACIPLGPIAFAASSIVAGAIACAVCLRPNKLHLAYSYREQASDLLPALGSSMAMGVIMYLASRLVYVVPLKLALEALVGATFYFAIAALRKDDSLVELVGLVRSKGGSRV